MARISVVVEIDAPPAVVWSTIEPIERHVDWMADAASIEFTTDQTRGIGTTFDCVTKVGPITLVDRMEITDWVPGQTMGVRHSGVVGGTGAFRLEPIDLDRRTRMVWAETLTFPWYLGGPLGATIGGKVVLRAIWRRNLRTLKHLVETR